MYVTCCINIKTVVCHDTAKANIFQKKFHKRLDHVRKVLQEINKSRLTAHAAGILDLPSSGAKQISRARSTSGRCVCVLRHK